MSSAAVASTLRVSRWNPVAVDEETHRSRVATVTEAAAWRNRDVLWRHAQLVALVIDDNRAFRCEQLTGNYGRYEETHEQPSQKYYLVSYQQLKVFATQLNATLVVGKWKFKHSLDLL